MPTCCPACTQVGEAGYGRRMGAGAPTFRRQVVVRIGSEDWSLLDDAVRQHGSQQAAIVAGLRALRRESEAAQPPPESAPAKPAAPSPPSPAAEPSPAPEPTPVQPSPEPSASHDDWWEDLPTAATIVGLDGVTLRKRIRDSGARTRTGTGTNGAQEVRVDELQVDSTHAAGLIGVTPDTIRARGRRGEMGAVERGNRYYFPLGQLEMGVNEAAERLNLSPDAVRSRIDRAELPHHRDERGRRRVRVLDVIAALG